MAVYVHVHVEQPAPPLLPRPQHDVQPDGEGVPPLLRCTSKKMQETGVYLVGKCIRGY